MDDTTLYMQYLGNQIQAGAGMIAAADLSANNRDFYKEQYAIQRRYNTQERLAAQVYNTQERVATQQWNEAMWNQQNEYNSPTSQMQRLVAAGINPNNAAQLVGGGAASSPAASVSPASSPGASVSAPSMPQQFNPAEAYASMMSANTLAAQQQSQAKLNDAVADKTREETAGIIIDNKFKPFEKQADLDEVNARIDLMVAQGEMTETEAASIREMLPFYKGKTATEIAALNEQILNYGVERDQMSEQINLLTEQIQTEKHKQKQMDAATFEAYQSGLEHKSAIDLNGKKMSLTEAETLLTKWKKEMEKIDVKWKKHLHDDYGFDPAEGWQQRSLSMLGYTIDRRGAHLQSLWNKTKVKLNSLDNPATSFRHAVERANSKRPRDTSWYIDE